jgi:hypothetical protein
MKQLDKFIMSKRAMLICGVIWTIAAIVGLVEKEILLAAAGIAFSSLAFAVYYFGVKSGLLN